MENNKQEVVSQSPPAEGEVQEIQVVYIPDYTATHGLEGHLNRVRAEIAQLKQTGVEL